MIHHFWARSPVACSTFCLWPVLNAVSCVRGQCWMPCLLSVDGVECCVFCLWTLLNAVSCVCGQCWMLCLVSVDSVECCLLSVDSVECCLLSVDSVECCLLSVDSVECCVFCLWTVWNPVIFGVLVRTSLASEGISYSSTWHSVLGGGGTQTPDRLCQKQPIK